MTLDSANENFPSDQFSSKGYETPVRQEMLNEAALLASFLTDRGNVKRIGIAGSLAKDKDEPSDIDFIIFVDNETAKACHREKMKLLREKSGRQVRLAKYLTIDDETWNWFVFTYKNCKYPFDIQVVSNNPDEEYIRLQANDNVDPNYFNNITDDVLVYEPEEDKFSKATIFNEQQRKLMEKASFDRLKEILSKPDERFYKTIEQSHTHLKRIGKAETGDEKTKSKIIDISEKEAVDLNKLRRYQDLIKTFDVNPFSQETFDQVVQLVRSELATDDGSGVYYFEDLTQDNFYEHVPFSELLQVGQRLRDAPSRTERYKILMEKNSSGELWYDIILGHVNDKAFQPVIDRIASLDHIFPRGLDVGCGSGNSLKMLAPFCQSCVGLDTLDIALDAARSSGLPENVSLIQGNGVKIPLANESCDIVTSSGMLRYLTSQEVSDYANEVVRVLDRGGVYYDSVVTIKEGNVLPSLENDYLASAKSVFVCLLDRICSDSSDIGTSINTISVLLENFKKLGVSMQFTGFDQNDVGVLEFHKS